MKLNRNGRRSIIETRSGYKLDPGLYLSFFLRGFCRHRVDQHYLLEVNFLTATLTGLIRSR